jgi:AraC family transcriptional regulator
MLPRNEVRQMEICIATRHDERTIVARRSDGHVQEGRGKIGLAWLCPAGVREDEVQIKGPLEILHIYLPVTRFEHRDSRLTYQNISNRMH